MITDSVIQLVKEPSQPTEYYVYYNQWDGNIISVGTGINENLEDPYILTDDEDAKKILMGSANERQFIVVFDGERRLLTKKSNVLRLRGSEKKFHEITVPKPGQFNYWDIRVHVYQGNNKLQIEVNSDSIRRLSSMTFNKQIAVDKTTDLSLYLCKKHFPDFFIEKIEIDPYELLTEGQITIDISHIRKYISLKDLGVFTRRVFRNYELHEHVGKLSIVQSTLVKNRNFVHNFVLKDLPTAHVFIEQQTGGLITFRTTLSSEELSDLGLYEDTLYFQVVGSSPDEYYHRIPCNIRELKVKKKTSIRVEGDTYGFNLMHKKNRVVFSMRNV